MSSDPSKAQTDLAQLKTQADGSYYRAPSSFRDTIATGTKFEPEVGRYHLYASYACPWAGRALIARALKGLQNIVGVTIASPRVVPDGYAFRVSDPDFPGVDDDPNEGAKFLKELYFKAHPDYTGRCTVPMLWDTKTHTVVNNESAEIVRIFNTSFNALLPPVYAALDLYPEPLRTEIDELEGWMFETVNNGVYRAGFASSQEAYEAAAWPLFKSLDRLEQMLTGKDYLVGDVLTEADVRLFVTMVRFDIAYVGQFRLNLRTIRYGYPAINLWMRKLYWNNAAFSDSTNFEHIKTGYYWPLAPVNCSRLVPIGPDPYIQPL